MIPLLLSLFQAHAAPAEIGGYFRVMTRPDLQGGAGRLGYWNLYGRLLNEGPYATLDFRFRLLERGPDATPWTSLHARIEGASIGNSDPQNGSLSQLRLSQTFVLAGNVLIPDVVWQNGVTESKVHEKLHGGRWCRFLFYDVGKSINSRKNSSHYRASF